jgi:phosphohistidine phosphatase
VTRTVPSASGGQKQASWLAEELEASRRPPDPILSSPLLRAWQTSELLADSLGTEIIELPTLALGHPPSDVIESLGEFLERRSPDAVALVGHNPQLEWLVAVLTEGPTAEPIRLRTGQCAVVDFRGSSPSVGGGTLSGLWRFDDD